MSKVQYLQTVWEGEREETQKARKYQPSKEKKIPFKRIKVVQEGSMGALARPPQMLLRSLFSSRPAHLFWVTSSILMASL